MSEHPRGGVLQDTGYAIGLMLDGARPGIGSLEAVSLVSFKLQSIIQRPKVSPAGSSQREAMSMGSCFNYRTQGQMSQWQPHHGTYCVMFLAVCHGSLVCEAKLWCSSWPPQPHHTHTRVGLHPSPKDVYP